MLGRRVVEAFDDSHDVVGYVHRGEATSLDIGDAVAVRERLRDERPDVVVNCAAYTAVDDCESNETTAYRVNARGPGNLARAAEEIGAAIVHVSTDYVFDGEKDGAYDEFDVTGPVSVYGRSKLGGEIAVRDMSTRWTIVRTCWLYGEDGPNFPETMIRLAKERDALDVVDDQRGSPTYTRDVARQILRLVEADERGLYHTSAGGEATWFDLAVAVLERAGLVDVAVRPVTTDRFPRPARRPRNSVLRNLALELGIGDSMRPWTAALDDYMERRAS